MIFVCFPYSCRNTNDIFRMLFYKITPKYLSEIKTLSKKQFCWWTMNYSPDNIPSELFLSTWLLLDATSPVNACIFSYMQFSTILTKTLLYLYSMAKTYYSITFLIMVYLFDQTYFSLLNTSRYWFVS